MAKLAAKVKLIEFERDQVIKSCASEGTQIAIISATNLNTLISSPNLRKKIFPETLDTESVNLNREDISMIKFRPNKLDFFWNILTK